MIFATASVLTGCFTGIEGTRRIELSRQDRRMLEPSPEESIFNSVAALPLKEWPKDKSFIVSDSKASLVYYSTNAIDSLSVGDRLRFAGVKNVAMPDGRDCVALQFSGPANSIYSYNTGKEAAQALSDILSDKLPMLIDAVMVARADSLLRYKKLWNKSSMAYLPDGERVNVLKFSEFTVDSVSPGKGFFPLKVWTSFPKTLFVGHLPAASERQTVFFYLDFNSSLAESRPPVKLFSLTDPKSAYPSVADSVWSLIRRGEVSKGMTKDECRLSLGNPSDANSGHDYNSTIDLWQYPDGTFLRFVDGVLHSFRK